jgi:hypothetical protein
MSDDSKTNRDLRELNKKTSTNEFKTYRNANSFLLKTFVARDTRDTTTINRYATTSNTIRTIVVIHVRFFVVVLVHHIARITREFLSFRNDQNLEASFCRDTRNSRIVERRNDANKTRKDKKTKRRHININLNFLLNAILIMSIKIVSK